MKKIITIALLLSSVNLINAQTWAERIQEALTGQPATVSTTSVPVQTDTRSWFERLTGQPAAVSTAPVADRPAVAPLANQSLLEKIRENLPSLIANIKLLAPKAEELASKASQGGWFSGLTTLFNMDAETPAAFLNLATQVRTVADSARSLLASADPAIQATVKGLLAQVVQLPQFQTLLQQAQNVPAIGGQLKEYLTTLTQAAH